MKKVLFSLFYLQFIGLSFAQTTVNLVADKDNTLYESSSGSLSNGAGPGIFAGRTQNGEIRRVVLSFDLSSIPANATITSVSLGLRVNRQKGGTHGLELRRLTSDWGEGSSVASGQGGGGGSSSSGDATWIHTFFSTSNWNSAGGDFVSTNSASASISGLGPLNLSDPQMIIDVQNWVDGINQNYGWIILVDESVNGSAKRFASKEANTAANRPTLTITYNTSTTVEEYSNASEIMSYPNPVINQLTLEIKKSKLQAIGKLIGVDGKEVMRFSLEQNKVSLDLSQLQNGLYFIELRDLDGRPIIKKIIKK
jgi:hypothetical protein